MPSNPKIWGLTVGRLLQLTYTKYYVELPDIRQIRSKCRAHEGALQQEMLMPKSIEAAKKKKKIEKKITQQQESNTHRPMQARSSHDLVP